MSLNYYRLRFPDAKRIQPVNVIYNRIQNYSEYGLLLHRQHLSIEYKYALKMYIPIDEVRQDGDGESWDSSGPERFVSFVDMMQPTWQRHSRTPLTSGFCGGFCRLRASNLSRSIPLLSLPCEMLCSCMKAATSAREMPSSL